MKKALLITALICALLLSASCRPIDDVSLRPHNPTTTEDPGSGEAPDDDDNDLVSDIVDPPEDDNDNNTPDDPLPVVSGFDGTPLLTNPTTINAPYGALYNLSDGVFVYGKGIDERVYPAGATKLLTALTVYENIESDFKFTVGKEIEMIRPESRVAGLYEEQVLSLEAILSALLIQGGNDAAYCISVNTARANMSGEAPSNDELNDYFLRLMNDYAGKLGCTGSNFVNPDGFHATGNHSTVRDLLRISAAAAENPMISSIYGSDAWRNANPFLTDEDWDIKGLILSYTTESGRTAQILAYIDGKAYIAVVSGCDSVESREQDISRLMKLAIDNLDGTIIDVS